MTGSSRLMGSYRDLPGQLLFRNHFQKKGNFGWSQGCPTTLTSFRRRFVGWFPPAC